MSSLKNNHHRKSKSNKSSVKLNSSRLAGASSNGSYRDKSSNSVKKQEFKKRQHSNRDGKRYKDFSGSEIPKGQIWIYGKHPVLMALRNSKRKILQILVAQNNYSEIEKFIDEGVVDRQIVKIIDNDQIADFLPENAVHQGFAVRSNVIEFLDDNNFVQKISNLPKNELPPILILDQLTDPHNIGAIIRSAAAFGVQNIVITKHNFPKESGIINKSSSGMVELVDIIVAGNLNQFLLKLKEVGYWCIGLDGSCSNLISEAKDHKPIALIVGSEGSGIRNLVRSNCDLLVKIPTNPIVESLNAANAASIALFELFAK